MRAVRVASMRALAISCALLGLNCITEMVVLSALSTSLMFSMALADDYLPWMSTATGREIGRAYRLDGTPPTKARGESDKKACLLDPREVPNAVADGLSALARTDRAAAEIEIAKVVIPCMAKKGWRIVVAGASAPSIERSTIATVDVVLDNISSSLPREMDEHSDLVGVKRDKTDIIFTIKMRPKSQAAADELRRFATTDPRAAEVMNKSLMKQSLCEPQPNIYLKAGFAVIWENF
jgi:hypothetical protein